MPVVELVEKARLRKNALPAFRVGDSVRVWVLIKEGDKERAQAFEGVVIRRHHHGLRSSFTVRKISYGVGVERIFPTHSPRIDRVDVVSRGEVRRARLFYLRERSGKAARIKERTNRHTDGNAEPTSGQN
ncbi:MAG TPA: 50S ribosomal protein L19 [Pseudomonadota bacterium]|nr:50S ribosomal protein L19 [Pseudomonadota bacterium]